MFGIVVIGDRLYGKIDDVDGTYVATLFRHYWWLPVFPKRSYVVVGDAEGLEDVGVGLVWRSVLAGYLRGWCAVLLVFALTMWSSRDGVPLADQPWLLVLSCVVGLVVGWGVLGRVSPQLRAQRRAYATLVGSAVDVALLYGQRAPVRERLHAVLRERFPHAIASYRGDPGAAPDWIALALSTEVTDPAFLRAALTLARLDAGEAKGEAARSLLRAHQAIWEKLAGSPPQQP